MKIVLFTVSFLVSNSQDTFVRENRWYWGGNVESVSRVTPRYGLHFFWAKWLLWPVKLLKPGNFGFSIFFLGTRAQR